MPTPPETSPERIAEAIRSVPAWYHVIDFGGGTVSPGYYDMRPHLPAYRFPAGLKGFSVLDVGASNGFFSFHFERLGAARVVAVELRSVLDHDIPEWVRTDLIRRYSVEELAAVDHQELCAGFETAHALLGSRVERLRARVYDLPDRTDEKFDWAFCGSVLYHLRDPVAALEAIRRVLKPGGGVVVATPVHEHAPEISSALFVGEATKCALWTFSPAALVRAATAAGFRSVAYQGDFTLVSALDPAAVHRIGVIHAEA